ncbi:MAG: alkylation response protein AidB-like acyl-CoA dehydrogenase [Myxococcota bacterium]|jgi:alkylation response protein AidB-like acyl-CoA dehydrogenase
MADYKVDLQDIRFVLRDQLKVEELTQTEKYGDFTWDDFELVIKEAERFAREKIFPLQTLCESEGASFEDGQVTLPAPFADAYKAFCRSGWSAPSADPELGGQGLPSVIGAMTMDMFIGACPSFAFVPGLAAAAAGVIAEVGSDEQRKKYCEKMFNGTYGGTMCLTEPQAGSAVGDSRTTAVKVDGTDYYSIAGNKIFISAADQNITDNVIHLVLARTPDAPVGVKGLSLFIVPRDLDDGTSNDVKVTNIEEKMGLHGSPTCSLSFGDTGACRGWILGGECEGISHMFLMMNEARIAVGLQGSSIANYAYQLALDYAKERVQGVDVGSMRDPNAKRVAIIDHPDVRRMLLTMKAFSEGSRSLLLTTASLVDRAHTTADEKKAAHYMNIVEVLTPICKAYASYRAFEVADLAIMTHGGYGYCTEYQVEGLLRDVKIAAIYEGTNGIQALDLLGRKVARKGGVMFMSTIGWLNQFVADHKANETVGPLVLKVEAAKNTLAAVTMELGGIGRKDIYYPALNASSYLEMFGDVVMGRLLVEQAAIASEKLTGEVTTGERRFYEGKIKTAEFFVAQLLPRVDMLAVTIRSGDRTALEIDFG